MMRDLVARIFFVMGTMFLLGFGEGATEKAVIVICIICIALGCCLNITED